MPRVRMGQTYSDWKPLSAIASMFGSKNEHKNHYMHCSALKSIVKNNSLYKLVILILKTISYKEWFLPWRHRYWTPWDAFGFIHLILRFVREAHSKLWWITFQIFCCISNRDLGIRIELTLALLHPILTQ
jgi:hypothetical protein